MMSKGKVFGLLNGIFLISSFQLSFASDSISTSDHSQSQAAEPSEIKSIQNNTDKQIDLSDPVQLLQNSIVDTQKTLIQNKDQLKKDPQALVQLIDTRVMPLLASDIIAQLLVGKARWQAATEAEQQKFITEITQMLAYSYIENIAQAGNYAIQIFPFSNDSWKEQRLVVVTGKITNLQNNSASDMSIKMLKTSVKKSSLNTAPQWKIYDLSVAGVSILDNFKAQFQDYKTLKDINLAIEKKNHELISKKSQ
ncbi:phospholipid-binding protein MlaC [Caedibacter taeniospiralis]|jgi:phospholipid transport system substrate-binding protein|uniref:phospholipid-binding protein MlaC n=1 Tax=Caedibacter taeniospiralis TaxID=28907 RepID=UPI0037C138E6